MIQRRVPCGTDAIRDAEVQAWNAALASGDPVAIAVQRQAILDSIFGRIMDDDEPYQVAGWKTLATFTIPGAS